MGGATLCFEKDTGSSKSSWHTLAGLGVSELSQLLLDLLLRRSRVCKFCRTAVDAFQVPCGIFDDPKLVADVNEAVATIKKAGRGSEWRWPSLGVFRGDGADR